MKWATLALALIFASTATAAELYFSVDDERIRNAFFREGPSAAHVVLKSGEGARLVVAFPAGNSGVGLWFGDAANFAPVRDIKATQDALGGAPRYGVAFETAVDERALTVKRAILSNVRVLRDYGYTGAVPPEVETAPRLSGPSAIWDRRRLDGAAGYRLAVTALNGRAMIVDGAVRFEAKDAAPLRLKIEALTGDPPLSGIPKDALFSASAGADDRLRNSLAFLSYDEKLLAGSWRFNTYFGRDTLMSIALLMPALSPRAVEAGLGAVIERLNDAGEVAHEEDLEEYALLTRAKRDEPANAEAILDYKMIDDDFMLAPVLAHYLLDTEEGKARAPAFLARKTAKGERFAARLLRNLTLVGDEARPFAADPRFENLIALKSEDPPVGQWRDSAAGLGFGRYAYDVNAALVPAALEAAARLGRSGLLGDGDGERVDWRKIEKSASIWRRLAPSFFRVRLADRSAEAAIDQYSAKAGVDRPPARYGAVEFSALSLDRDGRPIPILHSDVGFALFFGAPAENELQRIVDAPLRRFPAGLMTDAGMLVSNPVYASEELQAVFGPDRYHGAVVWSWQQALFAAGLERQLTRPDLTKAMRVKLLSARDDIWRAIGAGRDVQGSELWSWSYADGAYKIERFGQREADETESNAAQLWSTVYLGVACASCTND